MLSNTILIPSPPPLYGENELSLNLQGNNFSNSLYLLSEVMSPPSSSEWGINDINMEKNT